MGLFTTVMRFIFNLRIQSVGSFFGHCSNNKNRDIITLAILGSFLKCFELVYFWYRNDLNSFHQASPKFIHVCSWCNEGWFVINRIKLLYLLCFRFFPPFIKRMTLERNVQLSCHEYFVLVTTALIVSKSKGLILT